MRQPPPRWLIGLLGAFVLMTGCRLFENIDEPPPRSDASPTGDAAAPCDGDVCEVSGGDVGCDADVCDTSHPSCDAGCTPPQTCGGGGVPGQCGCDPGSDLCDPCTDDDTPPPCPRSNLGVCGDVASACVEGVWRCDYGEDFEEVESTCDGRDNDCDGQIDNLFGLVRTCSRGLGVCQDTQVVVCDAEGTEICEARPGTPPETNETDCGDGQDTDCDGLTDCEDLTDCPANAACGEFGQHCMDATCVCPGGEATETTCDDGQDNDCDGDADCSDPDCLNEECGSPGPPPVKCRNDGECR